jgi:hypothetical protein
MIFFDIKFLHIAGKEFKNLFLNYIHSFFILPLYSFFRFKT